MFISPLAKIRLPRPGKRVSLELKPTAGKMSFYDQGGLKIILASVLFPTSLKNAGQKTGIHLILSSKLLLSTVTGLLMLLVS